MGPGYSRGRGATPTPAICPSVSFGGGRSKAREADELFIET